MLSNFLGSIEWLKFFNTGLRMSMHSLFRLQIGKSSLSTSFLLRGGLILAEFIKVLAIDAFLVNLDGARDKFLWPWITY